MKKILLLSLISLLSLPSQAAMTKMAQPFFACSNLDVLMQIIAFGHSNAKGYDELYRKHLAVGDCRYIGPGRACLTAKQDKFVCMRMEGEADCWWIQAEIKDEQVERLMCS